MRRKKSTNRTHTNDSNTKTKFASWRQLQLWSEFLKNSAVICFFCSEKLGNTTSVIYINFSFQFMKTVYFLFKPHLIGLFRGLVLSGLLNGFLLPKLFWPTVRKNCSNDREKLLKFEAEGREFAKILRSLEQLIQTVKGQNNYG